MANGRGSGSLRVILVFVPGLQRSSCRVIEYPYQRLDAWKFAHAFALEISALSREFPSSERYLMVPQLVRAVRSIPANLAEGNGASGSGNFHRHVAIALGSLAEVDNTLVCARDEGYISSDRCEELRQTGWRIRGKMLVLAEGLRRSRLR